MVFVATVILSHYIFHDIKLKVNKTRIYILSAKTSSVAWIREFRNQICFEIIRLIRHREAFV